MNMVFSMRALTNRQISGAFLNFNFKFGYPLNKIMPKTNTHILWKGAISFGLVHIPIALHAATSEQGLNFDWLDKRSMDPVGYKRINKKTGKEIEKNNIVKGIEYKDGQYVIISAEEIADAYPKTTQTIELEAFVPTVDLPFIYFDRPYYVSPINKGEKVYALLREILLKTGKAGIARVVIQTKQHLAALIPFGPVLILNLLRWSDEIRPFDELSLPPAGAKATHLTTTEIKMGEQLVADMSTRWDPKAYNDVFKQQIMKLVKNKVKAGQTESVTPLETVETPGPSATIYDPTELLQRSLNKDHKSASTRLTSSKTATRPIRKTITKAKVS